MILYKTSMRFGGADAHTTGELLKNDLITTRFV
jgi:hypothetical protein